MALPPNVGPWQSEHYVDFGEQIKRFREETEGKLRKVFQFSIEELTRELQTPVTAGGRTPIDTGALIRSLEVRTDEMPRLLQRGAEPVDYTSTNPGIIATLGIGDTAYIGFTVHYGPYNEFGTVRGTPSRFFVRGAAQNWPRIVERAVRRANSGNDS